MRVGQRGGYGVRRGGLGLVGGLLLALLAAGAGCDGEATPGAGRPTDGGPGDGGAGGQDSGSAAADAGGGVADATPTADSGERPDLGPGADGTAPDAGPQTDLGPAPDAALDGGGHDGGADVDAGSGTPDAGDAGPGPDPQQLLWFLHVTDTHAGELPETAAALQAFLEQVVPVVRPHATLHSGDLVDLGGDAAQWTAYRAAVEGRVPAWPAYLEIVGNHDLKEADAAPFLAHSQTGRAGGGLWGQTELPTPAGLVRLLRTDTADTSLNPTNVVGYFGEAQAEALLALPEPASPPAATLLLAHHPMNGLDRLFLLGSDLRMQRLLSRFRPGAYLCGHLHMPFISWLDRTLSIQGGSLGKRAFLTEPSFVLLAFDGGRPTARSVPFDGAARPALSWPLLLVTAPADLGLGGVNPLATPLTAGDEVPVRALLFSPSPVDGGEARFDHGPWQPLRRVAAADDPRWETTLTVPGSGGVHALELRGRSAEGEASQTIAVQVEVR